MQNKAIASFTDGMPFAPEAFCEAEQLLAAFFDSSTVGLGIFDSHLRFQSVNGALAAMNGLPVVAHVGKSIREILGNLGNLEAVLRHVVATGEAALDVQISGHPINQAGAIHWIGNYFPIKDRLGNVKQIGAVVVDITKQKKLEESLHKLSSRLLEIRDDEQRRIARELHDSLGQYHVRLKLSLDILKQNTLDSDDQAELLAESTQLLDRCIAETRTISYLLHPPLLDEAGFVSAARWYVNGFAQRSGIIVNLDLQPDLGRLPERVEMALFRVLQESLTNVHRHARAATVDIRVQRKIDRVAMEIRDYGLGIPPEQLGRFQEPGSMGSVGVAGMRERVHELSGQLEIESDRSGTAVRVTIPVPCARNRSIKLPRKPSSKSAQAALTAP
jgi:PAS domain S-box-containing protein